MLNRVDASFLKDIFQQVLEDDALTIVAKGLGLRKLLVKLLQVECVMVDKAKSIGGSAASGKCNLVFVVNASQDAEMIRDAVVQTDGPEAACSPPMVVTNRFTSADRAKMYVAGGCFLVTSRILVVDLLTRVADPAMITGVIVDKAHRITEKSNEAFILSILRSTPSFQGYVKAFSDSPEQLASKFGFLSQVMSTLGLKKVQVWPRFHNSVRSVLDKSKLNVIEVSQPLTSRMAGIQSEIVTSIDMCLKELKQVQNIDVSSLTVENGLFRSFEVTLRKQLDPVWHKVSRKTKQLVHDVGVLRRLLPDLLRYDPVSFLRIFDSIKADASSQSPPLWLVTDAADKMSQFAKQRVYKIKRKKVGKRTVLDPGAFEMPTVLEETAGMLNHLFINIEESPKFSLLKEVMQEIDDAASKFENRKRKRQKVEATPTLEFPGGGCRTLILCRDSITCEELRLRLSKHGDALTERRLEMYLFHKFKRFCEKNGMKHLIEDNHINAASRQELDTLENTLFLGYTISPEGEKVKMGITSEVRLLCLAYLKHARGAWTATSSKPPMSTTASSSVSTSASEQAVEQEVVLLDDDDDNKVLEVLTIKEQSISTDLNQNLGTANNIILPLDSLLDNHTMLDELTPAFVVLYDPEVQIVRELEVYQAENPDREVTLYFLQYEESVEEQKYLSDLKREQDMFRKVIEEKATLVLPQLETSNATSIVEKARIQENTIIGYNATTGEPIFSSSMKRSTKTGAAIVPSVVVDMREFRSALPSMLHKNGVMVEPTTLEIGDYILSPEICVERKSIPDLHQSFSSGRLVTQVEAMCRYYARPNLLIEFDESKPFSLQAASELTGEISSKSIISKMALLVMQFPKLRLLWSPSPLATVDLFKLMKANYDQPNAQVAAKIGVPELPSIAPPSSSSSSSNAAEANPSDANQAITRAGTGEAPVGNISAQELLRRLPGVNVHNYGIIISKVTSLRHLSQMTLPDLTSLLGKVNAKRLYDFFNYSPQDSGSIDTDPVLINHIPQYDD